MTDVTEVPVEEEAPLVRYCHHCSSHDDHPKVTYIVNAANAATDVLGHYDCIPEEVFDAVHPDMQAAVKEGYAKGLKGDSLREHLSPVAQAIAEEGPDHQPHLVAAGYTPLQIQAHLEAAGHPTELAQKLAGTAPVEGSVQ